MCSPADNLRSPVAGCVLADRHFMLATKQKGFFCLANLFDASVERDVRIGFMELITGKNFARLSTFHAVFGENEMVMKQYFGYSKGSLVLLVALFGAVLIGCRQAERNDAPPQPAATPAATATPEPPQNRTIIKSSGWQLPIPFPKEDKKYHATTVVIEGRGLVKVLNRPFFPPEKLMVKFPKWAGDGEVEYKVTQILEMTDERKKPYCYQFFAEADTPVYSGTTTYLSYRDDDGDGLFETLGESCSVPAWVK